MRHQRWVILAFVTAAILLGLVVQAACVSGFAQFSVPDTRVGPITLSTVLALVSGIATFVVLVRNEKAFVYTGEVIEEMSKVTWPTKDETIRASTTVVITTVLVAILLAFYDLVWKNLADLVLLREG